jgi:hypothetical protein
MDVHTPCEALRSRRCLEIRYDGFVRVVEVHACGYTRDNHAVMRAWQVRGGSASNEPQGWKLLRLEETLGLRVLDETSEAPRKGFKRADRAMARILCEVDPSAVAWPFR